MMQPFFYIKHRQQANVTHSVRVLKLPQKQLTMYFRLDYKGNTVSSLATRQIINRENTTGTPLTMVIHINEIW